MLPHINRFHGYNFDSSVNPAATSGDHSAAFAGRNNDSKLVEQLRQAHPLASCYLRQDSILVSVRLATPHDYPTIYAIEQKAFEFPWTIEDFENVKHQRSVIGMVAERGPHILGYMFYQNCPGAIRLMSIAVNPLPAIRRHSVGRQLMLRLLYKLSEDRKTEITLDVRETNLAAQLFFKSLDFRAVRIIRGGDNYTPEDKYRMVYRLADSTLVSRIRTRKPIDCGE